MITTKITGQEFWQIKQETDSITTQLGWTKEYCKKYIQSHYGCHTRLTMTDWQLHDFLNTLRKLHSKVSTQKLLKNKKRSRRR
jgi:uncharacterized Fe-S cluster-containing radical SAM superfamily enzyme